jgi:predicted AlkP superfamily pyrophosphatase or phosphodiesterase
VCHESVKALYKLQHSTYTHPYSQIDEDFMTRFKELPARVWVVLFLCLLGQPGGFAGLARSQDEKSHPTGARSVPKLVVILIIDGLGQHQMDQLGDRFTDGFGQLLKQGAWFSHAAFGHSTTVTATGHATIVTGAYPYRHGQVSNEWFDPKTETGVYCVEDPAFHYVGEVSKQKHPGTSPKNLLVTTIGDELRLATQFKSRVFGVSMKDRGAILPAGRRGMAYFYSTETGRFITSTYYLKDSKYPEWWSKFHSDNPQNRWFQKQWISKSAEQGSGDSPEPPKADDTLGLGKRFPHKVGATSKQADSAYYRALVETPFSHDYLTNFCGALVKGEGLGKNKSDLPDILAVSYSSHDFINHRFGPESEESEDDLLRLDGFLSDFLKMLDSQVGLTNTLLVLSSDHGFSYSPEHWKKALDLDADRIYADEMLAKLNKHLRNTFGFDKMATSWVAPTIWLDYDFIDQRHLARSEVEKACAEFLLSYPGIHSVFTRSRLELGQVPYTKLGAMVSRSWHPRVSGDILIIQKDGWLFSAKRDEPTPVTASHGTPWEYDTRVPMIFMGEAWIKKGKYAGSAEPTDIAPTLAEILRIPPPSGSEGRVLTEILK